MGKFGQGSQPTVGHMGMCSQCRNKAEVKIYPGDNPDPICEDCHRENLKLEGFIKEKAGAVDNGSSPGVVVQVASVPEREKYIRCIREKASAEWIENFISEVVAKQILRFDFEQVLRNERWFTVLDLRRHALSIDPNVDIPPKPKLNAGILAMRKRRASKGKGAKGDAKKT